MMKRFSPLAIFGLAVVFSTPTFAEPYSPSCGTALEKVQIARKALMPFRRTMEMAKVYQYGAYGEAEVCVTGSRVGGDKSVTCSKSQWHSPKPDTFALAAIDQYQQERKTFEELFQQAKQSLDVSCRQRTVFSFLWPRNRKSDQGSKESQCPSTDITISRSRERLAYADLAVCARGGIFSVGRAVACNQASWKAPTRTKAVIEAEEDYRQARNEFEKSFEYAGQSCLLTP